MDALFVHGGPGLNSHPEKQLLGPALTASGLHCGFWNEPSRLRQASEFPYSSEKAFKNWLDSLESAVQELKPKLLIAQSFGALGAMHMLKRGNARVQRLIMVGPTLDLGKTFSRMFHFSEADYSQQDPLKASQIAELRRGCREFWDESMQRALALVWQNPKLLSHYFYSGATEAAWAGLLSGDHYSIDFASQQDVLNDLKELGDVVSCKGSGIDVPVSVLLGTLDPVVERTDIEPILKSWFSDIEYLTYEYSAHFPHLERKEEFIAFLKEALKRA